MYTGLLLGSFGAALATASPARMAFTALLAVILSAKVDKEEAALRVRRQASALDAFAGVTEC